MFGQRITVESSYVRSAYLYPVNIIIIRRIFKISLACISSPLLPKNILQFMPKNHHLFLSSFPKRRITIIFPNNPYFSAYPISFLPNLFCPPFCSPIPAVRTTTAFSTAYAHLETLAVSLTTPRLFAITTHPRFSCMSVESCTLATN